MAPTRKLAGEPGDSQPAPEISGSGAAALTLLFGSLAVLRGRRRRAS